MAHNNEAAALTALLPREDSAQWPEEPVTSILRPATVAVEASRCISMPKGSELAK